VGHTYTDCCNEPKCVNCCVQQGVPEAGVGKKSAGSEIGKGDFFHRGL